MDEAAVAAAIKAAISEAGAATAKDMGKVMGVLKAKYAGQMDFQKASAAVKAGWDERLLSPCSSLAWEEGWG